MPVHRDIDAKTVLKARKEGIKGEIAQLNPIALIHALRALRAVRRSNGLHSRQIELLMAINAMCERNERRDEIAEPVTCWCEIKMLIEGVIEDKGARQAHATLRTAGLITCTVENPSRWTWKAMSYRVTEAGKQIIKQYRDTLQEIQIEINKGGKTSR